MIGTIFTYMTTEIMRITTEYSSDAGTLDKFATCFNQTLRRNNQWDSNSDGCLHVHTRSLTDAEITQLNLPAGQYFAFVLDDIIDVMCKRLNNVRKDEFNVKGLKLLFRNQLRHQGVTEDFINFYDFSLLQQHQKTASALLQTTMCSTTTATLTVVLLFRRIF